MTRTTSTAAARKALAETIAEITSDAYSFDRYTSWVGVAEALLKMGYTEREARGIMRSKWMRWAADRYNRYGRIPAKAIVEFITASMEQDAAETRAEIAYFAAGEENLDERLSQEGK